MLNIFKLHKNQTFGLLKMFNPFNTIGNFGYHLNFTQLLDKQVA